MDKFRMNIQLFAEGDAEQNAVTQAQMAKAREVDFVLKFTGNVLQKLIEALGVTRKVPMEEGTTLYYYKSTGELQSGAVAEGAVIPLSQYSRNKYPIGEITLQKYRKAVTAEAIKKSGYDEAVRQTDAAMIRDIQKGIRADLFSFLQETTGTPVGAATLQAVLAKSWGMLQVLFENDAAEAVHFINPMDIADYLASATITTQSAFGMSYIEDFLGLGTVILNSQVPKGTVYSTVKDNIILYYLSMNGDVATAFNLTTDATGYIGMHTSQTDNRAQIETLVMYGIRFLAECADGVVVGMIDATPSLQSATVTSAAGTAVGDSNITLSGYTLGSGEKWVYKTGTTAPNVKYGQSLKSWTEIDSGDDITPAEGHTKITVAAVDANNRAQAAGSATLTVKT